MKPRKVSKKLNLKKVTVSALNNDYLNNVKGRTGTTAYNMDCTESCPDFCLDPTNTCCTCGIEYTCGCVTIGYSCNCGGGVTAACYSNVCKTRTCPDTTDILP